MDAGVTHDVDAQDILAQAKRVFALPVMPASQFILELETVSIAEPLQMRKIPNAQLKNKTPQCPHLSIHFYNQQILQSTSFAY